MMGPCVSGQILFVPVSVQEEKLVTNSNEHDEELQRGNPGYGAG